MGLRRKNSPTMESEVLFPGESGEHLTKHNQERLRQSAIPKPSEWGTRHTLGVLGFLGFAVSYAMRVNLSLAIVSMTKIPTNSSSHIIYACPNLMPNKTSLTLTYPNADADVSSRDQDAIFEEKKGEFDWDGEDQGIILGSFFYGYVLTQVPGGILAEKIGGKYIFGIGMLVTAIFSLLTPVAARMGKGVLITVRIIQGLGEGVTNPSMHALLARWIPPLERSKIGAFTYAGTQIGTVIAMPLSGYLISSEIFGGWPSVFYVFGIIGIIWFIFWCYFVHNFPTSHPRIDAKELAYIQQTIGHQTSKHRIPTPWKKIFTSWPVFAILIAQTGHGWGLYTLLTELPTYMSQILHFDIKHNSVYSALPYLGMWIVSVSVSYFGDNLIEKGHCTTTTIRKLFNTIAHWCPAFCLVLASYSGCNRFLTVSLLTAAVSLNGAAWASFQINHIDIAPNHAGVLMGITNGIANLCGIGAPYVAGLIIKDGATLDKWQIIFFIAAAIYFCDNIVYLMFATAEEQSWNRDPNSESKIIGDESADEPLLGSGSRSISQEIPSTSRSIP